MKKKLVVLLAVVMMFAFSASAYAATFSDVSERPVVEQDAIKKAVALGIIEGYEDGTFGPDKTITRAEFAKIAVTAAGAKDTATMLEGNASNFKDVKANSWYTGWINASESLGIFKGDTNGNFRPNDTISNQEAITVLMRLLGYNDNLTGSWPVNYVTKANQINILDDVNIVASAAAKRGDITVMLSETLDSDLVTYDKDTNEFVKKQTTKSGSDYITLLADSFEGSYIEVNNFSQIDQLRDVPAQTLNWGVGSITETVQTTTNGVTSTYERPANYKGTLIVDKDTAVSYNAADLFDLENHQGKVYYVKETDGKLYARFIEVESYVQTVTDTPTAIDNGSRVQVNKTNYNAANTVSWSTNAPKTGGAASTKNTNYSLYFNDDDQVYRVVSDKDFDEKVYYVKSVSTSSARLVGTKTKTVNMSDADTLIYDGDKFISPSDLKVGDAIREIAEGDLYVKVNDVTGALTRYTSSNGKLTIGGKAYVAIEDSSKRTANPLPINFYEEDLNDSDVALDDVYNNNVRYILDKNNVIAAIIVDETSTGTTLYGIIVDGEDRSGSWANSMSSVTLFNQEGNTVVYDFEKNFSPSTDKPGSEDMGKLVKFKLNANGEIKSFKVINYNNTTYDNSFAFDEATNKEIEVKNNAYLVDSQNKSLALASNVIIFEVGKDDTDVDPSLVTRSSLLSGGDFTPQKVEGIQKGKTLGAVGPYAVYDTNSNGAIKVLAYTDANSSNYNFGVVKAYNFRDYDNDNAITLVGDDTVFELDMDAPATDGETTLAKGGQGKYPTKWTDAKAQNKNSVRAAADYFVIYTQSGDKIKPQYAYQNDRGISTLTQQVVGFNSGLITVDKAMAVTEYNATVPTKGIYNIMTDTNTQVFVIDAKSGDYVEGSLSDISRNSYVFVPVVNKDGYAEVVLVDDYTPYSTGNNNGGNNSSASVDDPTIKITNDKDAVTSLSGVNVDADSRVSGKKVTVSVYVTYDTELYKNYDVTIEYGDQKERGVTEATFDVQDGVRPVVTVDFRTR